jgi:hypothetical protein
MRRLSLVLALSLLPAPVLALPGDGRVRIVERSPREAARPHAVGGVVERPGPRPHRARRRSASRRAALRSVPALPGIADQRQGWQLLGTIAQRLEAMSEALFEAGAAEREGSLARSVDAGRQEARVLTHVLVFCRAQAPSRPTEQASWRRACDELLRVARDCAAGPAEVHPRATARPVVATPSMGADLAAPADDPLQRLEQQYDALARAREIVEHHLPSP